MKKKVVDLVVVDVVSVTLLLLLLLSLNGYGECSIGEQPLSKIAIHKATLALRDSASIKAHPLRLGLNVLNLNGPHPFPSSSDLFSNFVVQIKRLPAFNLMSIHIHYRVRILPRLWWNMKMTNLQMMTGLLYFLLLNSSKRICQFLFI